MVGTQCRSKIASTTPTSAIGEDISILLIEKMTVLAMGNVGLPSNEFVLVACLISAGIFAIAGLALPTAVWKMFAGGDKVDVVALQRMTLRTMSFGSIPCHNRVTYKSMLAPCQRLKVLRVATGRIVTSMVENMTIWNCSDQCFIDDAMC